MKNVTLNNIDYQMLMELSKKQGVNINSFVSTLVNNLYTEMKRTGRKPLWNLQLEKDGYGKRRLLIAKTWEACVAEFLDNHDAIYYDDYLISWITNGG